MPHPYDEFLHRVRKPSRYVGGEYNQVRKDLSAVDVSMVLAFPDLYDLGMSHLGTKILYSVLNKHPRIAAERAFAPWHDMEAELRERGLPVLTLESARPLAEFDVVGFSLQYELTFTNVLNLLDLSRIPLRAADRDLSHPLIIAGGPVATQPEPMAPFIDAFLIGDGEERLPQLLLKYKALKEAGVAKEAILVALAQLGGIYCPALHETVTDERTGFEVVGRPRREGVPERIERALVEDLSRYPFPDDSPVAHAEAIFDRMSVEIARGCTEGCRFCQAGMIYRPVRERDPQEVIDTLVSAIEKGGYDEAALTTLSTADYSCISPLIKGVMKRLRPEKVSLGVASLRAYGLDEDLLDEISSVRATGLTFAPEAGTQRMRDVITKNVTEDDLYETAHRIFQRGWKRMKLYFMIGLPTEEDEDVEGIVAMGRQARQIGEGHLGRKRAEVVVSVSTHVPKPHTPFQWCAMDGLDEVARKQTLLRGLAYEARVKLKTHDASMSFLEGVIGRGDRTVADAIEIAWRKGCRFDGWDEHLDFDAWVAAFAEAGVEPSRFLGTIPVDVRLPWDHVDVGLADGFLLREYKRALKNRLSPPCSKPLGAQVHHTNVADAEADRRKLVCYHCGVACDLTAMREERIDFLKVLGAERPPEPKAEPAPLRRPRKGEVAHRFEQGERVRYRLRYRKTATAALQGHLDVVRLLPRIFRRAGIDLFYSQGFHPKPVMSFAPALSLGSVSLGEIFDAALTAEIAPHELIDRLNAVSPPGFEFTGAVRLADDAPKLARAIDAADWLVVPTAASLADAVGDLDPGAIRERLAARAAEVLEAGSLEIAREGRGEEGVLDLGGDVLRLEVGPAGDLLDGRAIDPAALPGEPRDLAVLCRLRVRNAGLQARAADVVRAAFGVEARAPRIARLGLWRLDGDRAFDPLDDAPARDAVEPPAPVPTAFAV